MQSSGTRGLNQKSGFETGRIASELIALPTTSHPQETQPKENLFCERNIYPSHFQREEVELELQSPACHLPSLRQELSLLWETHSAAGVEQGAVRHPRKLVVAVRFERVLSSLTHSAHSREIFTRTQGPCRGASRVSAALL